MKPILFQKEMVTKILEGVKTQTRRVKKGDDKKPKYQVGDLLYVRETWRPIMTTQGMAITYKQDENFYFFPSDQELITHLKQKLNGRWYPSIFLPKVCSRIILKVKNVSEDKLQNITFEDRVAEGVKYYKPTKKISSLSSWIELWDSINNFPYRWRENPTVFKYEFEIHEVKNEQN